MNNENNIKGLNPFLPFGIYTADGEPKVFGNRVYLYGSNDLFDGGYCSKEYHVYSAPVDDLTDWTDHGISFTTDAVPWSDAVLYAPDALLYNGVYYLFFCLSDGSEGVAQSNRPEGPFVNARRITLNGQPITGIDPSVLEDNGKIYYTWGQFNLNMGELNEDMCTLKSETVRTGIITNEAGGEGFHEGSSLRKVGNKYCLIYASEYSADYPNNGARPTKLDYAVSDSPYGPYERRGTVIDNDGCDPETWNNHGSIIKINGEWFVFYHASSNSSAYSRRARAERIRVDEGNCVITEASPTSNGFQKTLPAESIASPVNARRFYGGAYVTEKDGGFPAVGLKSGAGFSFGKAVYTQGDYKLTVTCRPLENGTVRFLIDGKTAAEIPFLKSDSLCELSARFTAHSGAHITEFAVSGAPDSDLAEIYSLKIEKTD